MTEDVCDCVGYKTGEYTSCLQFSSRQSPKSPRNDPRVSCREQNLLNTISVTQINKQGSFS